MTQEQFINWLTKYLDQCERDQIALIREKLALVTDTMTNTDYASNINLNNTSAAGDVFSWPTNNTTIA